MSSWARGLFRIARAAALQGILLGPLPAAGAEPSPQPLPTILLIEAGEDPTATRVAAELRASGLPVTTVHDASATPTDLEIQQLARSASAVAVMDIDAGAGQVRIWTVSRSTGLIVLRSLVPSDDDAEVVALRAVEALRALLNDPTLLAPRSTADSRETIVAPRAATAVTPGTPATPATAATPATPAAPVTPVTPVAAASAERPRTGAPATAHPGFAASLAPAFAAGGGHFAGSWQVLASLEWFWAPRWGVELVGVAPLTSARRSDRAGTATLVFALVAGGVRARALAARWCVLDFGAGIGTGALYTQGSPNQGFYGTGATTWVATPYARIGYDVAVTSRVWLRADLTGIFATPRPTFATVDEVASWGEPLLLASIGVAVAFR
jgi:hypothetical protein